MMKEKRSKVIKKSGLIIIYVVVTICRNSILIKCFHDIAYGPSIVLSTHREKIFFGNISSH